MSSRKETREVFRFVQTSGAFTLEAARKAFAGVRYVWRSAITGRFITKAKADEDKRTTYRDKVTKPCKR